MNENRLTYLRQFIFDRSPHHVMSHTHDEIEKCVRLVKSTKVSTNNEKVRYAEIGSRCGGSVLAAKFGDIDAECFCFDLPNQQHYGGIPDSPVEFTKATRGLKDIKLFLGKSQLDGIKSAIKENGPYDIFLVDGDHSHKGAMQDLQTAYGSLKNGGCIIFDDIVHHPYLKRTAIQFAKQFEISDLKLIEKVSQDQIDNGYLLRGVAIMRK